MFKTDREKQDLADYKAGRAAYRTMNTWDRKIAVDEAKLHFDTLMFSRNPEIREIWKGMEDSEFYRAAGAYLFPAACLLSAALAGFVWRFSATLGGWKWAIVIVGIAFFMWCGSKIHHHRLAGAVAGCEWLEKRGER